jgi:hypothetical protein
MPRDVARDSSTKGNTARQSEVQGDDRDVQGMRWLGYKNGTAERSKSCIIDRIAGRWKRDERDTMGE